MAQKKNFKTNPAMQFISATEEPEAPKAQEGFVVPKGYRLEREVKSVRMQLLVRPTTKDAIKNAAAAQGLSMNDLVNQILDEYIERQANK